MGRCRWTDFGFWYNKQRERIANEIYNQKLTHICLKTFGLYLYKQSKCYRYGTIKTVQSELGIFLLKGTCKCSSSVRTVRSKLGGVGGGVWLGASDQPGCRSCTRNNAGGKRDQLAATGHLHNQTWLELGSRFARGARGLDRRQEIQWQWHQLPPSWPWGRLDRNATLSSLRYAGRAPMALASARFSRRG